MTDEDARLSAALAEIAGALLRCTALAEMIERRLFDGCARRYDETTLNELTEAVKSFVLILDEMA